MSATSKITLPENLRTLEQACDVELMLHRLSEYTPVIAGGGTTLQKVEIPRVMLQRDGAITIQYILSYTSDNNRPPVERHLCGRWSLDLDLLNAFQKRLALGNIRFEKLNLLIPLFPDDPDLKSLSELSEPSSSLGAGTIFEFSAGERFTVSQVISYRLGRRCVLQGEFTNSFGSSQKAFCKISKPKRSSQLVERHRNLACDFAERQSAKQDTAYMIPEILFAEIDSGVIITKAVAARPLYNLIGEPSFSSGCGAAGGALAALHQTTPENLTQTTVLDELVESQRRNDRIARLLPELAAPLSTRLRALEDQVVDVSTPLTACHGDYYDKQTLLAKGTTALIDFDSLRQGDPAQDLGNFAAHLNLRGIQRHSSPDAFAEAERRFFESYKLNGKALEQRVNWWRAISLLRLVSVYVLRPQWKTITPMLFSAADKYIELLTRKHRSGVN